MSTMPGETALQQIKRAIHAAENAVDVTHEPTVAARIGEASDRLTQAAAIESECLEPDGSYRPASPYPARFCWTHFGVEAGETVADILKRKEMERVANGGVFLWGIGSSVKPSMKELVRLESDPEVLFSPIFSLPRQHDVAPPTVVAWTEGETLSGSNYRLPEHSLVTSRMGDPARKRCHYALVCFSAEPLELHPKGPGLVLDALRNLLTGERIGGSQVTAVVSHDAQVRTGRRYTVSLRVRLVEPFFLRLTKPLPVHPSEHLLTPNARIGLAP